MPVQPMPRERLSELSYERFLREYALPRQPVIIEGVGADWAAASAWHDLQYFLDHEGVDREHEVTVHEGGPGSEECETTVGDALRRLHEREAAGGHATASLPLYLSAWDYVRGGSSALQADFAVPALFDRSPRWLAEHVLFGCASLDMKWLYLGEAGTGSAPGSKSRPARPVAAATRLQRGSFVPPGLEEPACDGIAGAEARVLPSRLHDARRHEHDLGLVVGGARREGVAARLDTAGPLSALSPRPGLLTGPRRCQPSP